MQQVHTPIRPRRDLTGAGDAVAVPLPSAASKSLLPSYIPELDGLRGLAIAAVVIYHCHDKLRFLHLDSITQWGWVGVNLFFVLSGFLITGIIADSRQQPNFFRNFYARRGLRIWPVYLLLLLLNYVVVPLVFGSFWWAWHEVKGAPWAYYLLFIQNLFFIAIPGTVGPTWSLAIEEQFYILWAPIARFFRAAFLIPVLAVVIIGSPVIRMFAGAHLTPTHTLIHLDGLAVGSLIALGLRSARLSESTWRTIARVALALGVIGAIIMLFHGWALTDSFLAIGFGGMLLTAIAANRSPNAYGSFLKLRPLKFLGTISYGLYMTHILVFVVIGAFDARMEQYGALGNLAIVVVRLVLSISAATLLWYGFERPILALKHRFFAPKPKSTAHATPVNTLIAAPEPIAAD
ncbi:MAG TPA: acyltransferase [Clostridia bacterium]|nr:acyltransferase [Clostridia bacterium]